MYIKYTGTTPHIMPDGRSVRPDEAPVLVDEKNPEVQTGLDSGMYMEVDPSIYEEQEPSRDEKLKEANEIHNLNLPKNISNKNLDDALEQARAKVNNKPDEEENS